jgi:hypothetical protein
MLLHRRRSLSAMSASGTERKPRLPPPTSAHSLKVDLEWAFRLAAKRLQRVCNAPLPTRTATKLAEGVGFKPTVRITAQRLLDGGHLRV